MSAFGDLVARERFLTLDAAYGYCAPDLGERSLEVKVNGRVHRVRYCDMRKPGTSRAGVRAFLRVWYGVLIAVSSRDSVVVYDADQQILRE
jgi:hypothetical protein